MSLCTRSKCANLTKPKYRSRLSYGSDKSANEGTSVGSITYEGESPFRVMPARGSTARVSGYGVEMTVYPVVEGKPSAALQIQVPMSPNEARQLS